MAATTSSSKSSKFQTLATMRPHYQQAHLLHQHQQQLHNHYAINGGQFGHAGSQTISRSSNLHHQHHQQQQQRHKNVYQTDQLYAHQANPYAISYAYDLPIHQMYSARYGAPAAMSLAVRAPKERGPIPSSLAGAGATLGRPMSLSSSSYSTKARLDMYDQQNKLPLIYQEPIASTSNLKQRNHPTNKPLCRCRVMYLGSSVPHLSKNGLHGIQEPLRHLYPEEQFTAKNMRPAEMMSKSSISQTVDISHLSSSLGIDSWLSVWSNGLLLENVDEFGREMKRFYSIESLHYCAAVRFFDTNTLTSTQDDQNNNNNNEKDANNNEENVKKPARFLPLDAPIFQAPGMLDPNHPPVFAAIMRRTTGIKVLECHAFICRRDAASNALVRCCTHAYSDFLSAKRLSADLGLLQAHHLNAYRTQQLQPFTSADYNLKTRTMPHNRRFRSTSAGRHQQRRAPLDTTSGVGGPYQVIEAIVQADTSTGSGAKSKSTSVSKQAANSTGTNSNDLTHSDDDDDDDDNESLARKSTKSSDIEEDNYAIIPKQQQLDARLRRTSGGSQARRRSRRKAKGSSRSLFNDFMPVDHGQLPVTCSATGSERLSHSLDYLQMIASRGVGAPDGMELAAPEAEVQAAQTCSLVGGGRNKRHSRSMQNLHRKLQQQLDYNQQQQQEYQTDDHQRKATSCLDIPTPPQIASSSSLQRRRRRHSRRAAAAAAENAHSGASTPASSRRQRHEPAHELRVLGPDCCQTKATPSSSGSSSSRANQRHASSDTPPPPPPPPLPLPSIDQMAYVVQPPQAGYFHAHPQMAPPPPPHPYGAHYYQHLHPSAGAYYTPTLYPANSMIYDTITPPPPPPPPLPAGHYYNPMMQQQHQQFEEQADRAPDSRRSRTKSKAHSATLATRFRCLSPPLNIFGSAASRSQRHEERAAANEEESSPVSPSAVVSGQPGFMATKKSDARSAGAAVQPRLSWIKRLSMSLSSSHSNRDSCTRPVVDPSGGGGGGSDNGVPNDCVTSSLEPEAQTNANNEDGQLLADQAGAAGASEPKNLEQQQQQTQEEEQQQKCGKQTKAKRSGLFSLTLGRSSGQKSSKKLVT